MNKADKTAAVLLALLSGCFVAGLCALLMLRFETGDLFPAYSSLRTDPLGVKVLFQALEHMPDLSVERNFRPLSKLAGGEKTTLFYLGIGPDFLIWGSKSVTDQMESLAKDGDRVVVTFRSGLKKPATRIVAAGSDKTPDGPKEDAPKREIEHQNQESPKSESEKPKEDPQKPVAEQPGDASQKSEAEQPKKGIPEKKESSVPTGKRWEVGAGYLPKQAVGETKPAIASLTNPVGTLPRDFPLHTAFCFENPGQEWRVLYSSGECPIIIERSMGAGSILLVADSFLFSNEAMLKERHAEILSWLAGNSRRIVFDEFHLGVSEHPGMMTLLRKYRLHWFLAALCLLAVLFAWQSMVRFNPERTKESGREPGVTPGINQLDGLINLLQRNIKSEILLKTCFEEWEKSVGKDSRGMQDRIRQARELIQAENDRGSKRDLTAVYRQIARILSDRKIR
jgi:hypothetical protein